MGSQLHEGGSRGWSRSTNLEEDSRHILFGDLRKGRESTKRESQEGGQEREAKKESELTVGSKLTISTNFSMWKA